MPSTSSTVFEVYDIERTRTTRFALGHVTPRVLSTRLDELNGIGAVDKSIVEVPRPSFLYLLHQEAKPPVKRMAADLTSLL